MERAQEHVDLFGVPICDFKIYRRTVMEQRPIIRFKNTVRRAVVLQCMNRQTDTVLTGVMEQMKNMYLQAEEK